MNRDSISLLKPLVAAICCLITLPLAAQTDSWPTFNGADRTNVAAGKGLLKSWPDQGPELIWEATGAGQGYASVAISDGKLYTLGDGIPGAEDKDEYLTCFSLADGKSVWKVKTGEPFKLRNAQWQSSRSTPTVDGDRVYVLTGKGKLFCATTDGKEKWQVDLKKEYGGKKAEMWGYSESVLIDGDNVICTPGGPEHTMVALNKMNGEKVWSTPRENDRGAGHASIVISKVGDMKVYVQTTGSGAMGVRASDGKLLWTYNIPRTTAVCPSPIVRDDLVFFAAGYGRGGALLRQSSDGDGAKVEEVYPLKPELCNKHGGIVLVGDYLYGDSDDKGRPYCAELMTGEIKWKSRGSGKKSASVTAADGKIYIRYSNGVMTLVNADPEKFEEVGSFKVPGSGDRPSWAHPVVLAGRLYLREGNKVLCYSVSVNGDGAEKTSQTDTMNKDGEMLTNGDFAKGMEGWHVDKGNPESGKAEVVKEGPEGAMAAKIEVISIPDQPWQLQLFHPGLKIVKDKSYVFTFWAKAKTPDMIKVNVMQNHEPWEHSTEEDIYVTTKWKKHLFRFNGPWDEEKARMTFTNLGTEDGQNFWFAGCSLKADE